MLEEVKVGSIMIPLDKYPNVRHTMPLKEVMKVFESIVIGYKGLKSLPRSILVFNDEYELIGRVRRRNILKGLEPDFLVQKPLEYRKKIFDTKINPELSGFSYDEIIESVINKGDRPVLDVVEQFVTAVNYDDHIFKAIYEMNSHNQNLLPVLRDNDAVGVVRTVDIFSAVAELFK